MVELPPAVVQARLPLGLLKVAVDSRGAVKVVVAKVAVAKVAVAKVAVDRAVVVWHTGARHKKPGPCARGWRWARGIAIGSSRHL